MTSKEALARVKVLLGLNTEYNFNSYKVAEGGEFKVDGELEVGKQIYVITEDGELPSPDGTFQLETGEEVKVVDAIVAEIILPKEEEVEEEEVVVEEEAMETEEEEKVEEEMTEEEEKEEVKEKAFVEVSLVDGTIVGNEEEELAVGQQLMILTEDGGTIAPDGEHETEDGKVIVIVDGIITEIKEKEVVVEEEISLSEVVETFTNALEVLKGELENLKNTNNELTQQFNAFRAEPAGKKVLTNKTVRQEMGAQKLDKLTALSNLRKK